MNKFFASGMAAQKYMKIIQNQWTNNGKESNINHIMRLELKRIDSMCQWNW